MFNLFVLLHSLINTLSASYDLYDKQSVTVEELNIT